MRQHYCMVKLYEDINKEGVLDSENGKCLMYTYAHNEIHQPKLMMLCWCFMRSCSFRGHNPTIGVFALL